MTQAPSAADGGDGPAPGPDLAELWEHAPSGNVLLDDGGVVTAVNATFATWTGHPRDELVGTSFGRLLATGDRILFASRLLPQLAITGRLAEASVQLLDVDGFRRPALMSATRVVTEDGRPQVRIVLLEADERRKYELQLLAARRRAEESEARIAQAQADLQSLVHHDALTGLLNRTGFLRALHERLRAGPTSAGAAPTVVFVDLDDFKTVNDDLGHGAGDELLRVVAGLLLAASPAGAAVARFAGDEFVVLVDVQPSGAGAVAQALLDTLVAPVLLQGVEVFVEASVGVCQATAAVAAGEVEQVAERLVRRADMAMYRAKSQGGGRHEVHRAGTVDPAADRLVLLEQLRAAVRGDQLRVDFQPQVHLATGTVSGVEALVRWQHPDRGLLPPAAFIGPAEDSGIIRELGGWVMAEALAQVVRWDATGAGAGAALQVAVNLSTRQLADGDLVDRVRKVLDLTGVEPSRVVLEITETALMRRPEAALQSLRELKAIGVRVAVDDFGTGYSSLTYLKRFPVDELKIDRSFVAGMTVDASDHAIVAACVHLAHDLGLTAVAEGVEEDRQRQALLELGCDRAQGYLLGRPQPPDGSPPGPLAD